jgi:hypothetical protein
MPGGTIISGRNTGPEQAIVVVVWANLSNKGPLSVYELEGTGPVAR